MNKAVDEIKGSEHYRWNDKKMISSTGYAKIRVGKAHTLACPNGYCYEHLLVWVAAGNPRPSKGQVIHHVNGNKLDNSIQNLEIISRSSHNQHHNEVRGRDNLGRFQPLPLTHRLPL